MKPIIKKAPLKPGYFADSHVDPHEMTPQQSRLSGSKTIAVDPDRYAIVAVGVVTTWELRDGATIDAEKRDALIERIAQALADEALNASSK